MSGCPGLGRGEVEGREGCAIDGQQEGPLVLVDSRTGAEDTHKYNGNIGVTLVNHIHADSLGAESCDSLGKRYHRENLAL